MFVLYVFVLYITFFFKHAQFDLEVYAPRKESNYVFYHNQIRTGWITRSKPHILFQPRQYKECTNVEKIIYKNHKKTFQAQILFQLQHSDNETMNHIYHNKSSPLSQ